MKECRWSANSLTHTHTHTHVHTLTHTHTPHTHSHTRTHTHVHTHTTHTHSHTQLHTHTHHTHTHTHTHTETLSAAPLQRHLPQVSSPKSCMQLPVTKREFLMLQQFVRVVATSGLNGWSRCWADAWGNSFHSLCPCASRYDIRSPETDTQFQDSLFHNLIVLV